MIDMVRARWIGCTQNGGPMLDFNIKKTYVLLKYNDFFNELDPLGYVEVWTALC